MSSNDPPFFGQLLKRSGLDPDRHPLGHAEFMVLQLIALLAVMCFPVGK